MGTLLSTVTDNNSCSWTTNESKMILIRQKTQQSDFPALHWLAACLKISNVYSIEAHMRCAASPALFTRSFSFGLSKMARFMYNDDPKAQLVVGRKSIFLPKRWEDEVANEEQYFWITNQLCNKCSFSLKKKTLKLSLLPNVMQILEISELFCQSYTK